MPKKPRYQLVTRFCRCGCGCSFRVLPTSEAWYASYRHETQTPRMFGDTVIDKASRDKFRRSGERDLRRKPRRRGRPNPRANYVPRYDER